MPVRVSESIILRTYPLREADLIVSFFTRDEGKLRGVARRARRPANRFGSGMERLSYVNMHYYLRENRELMTLDSCDIVRSQFPLAAEYSTSVAGDFIAEVADHMLPAHEANERMFRLILAATGHMMERGAAGAIEAATYFALWSVRLSGFLPELELEEQDHAIASEMLVKPVGKLTAREWTPQTARGLRRQLIQLIEDHIERRILSVRALEGLAAIP
ncbi:MAG: DNA repair protein RecO [Acidobacteria bacterium]|nr:DNA repair protein RecO [Acidobacteriota bacterium]